MGAAGEGRASLGRAGRLRRAAAAVLAGGDHAGRTYELAGDATFTLAELAAVVADASGKPMTYQDMNPRRSGRRHGGRACRSCFARLLSDTDAGVAKGALFDDGGDLARLLGRPTTPYQTTVAAFVRNQPAPGQAAGHG